MERCYECRPICDCCENYSYNDHICKIDGTEMSPYDTCEGNFKCELNIDFSRKKKSNKIEVTRKFLEQVLEHTKEMKRQGTWSDLDKAQKIINNTRYYLNK